MFDLLIPNGCYVVAVSGGVDSVVLLDILSRQPGLKLIVAHFDHGIRTDSGLDADFVKSLALKYGLLFETKREELGSNASEDLARTCRYNFLRTVAEKHEAKLITAHHADDVIETIVINLLRGTGWRGLAVLDSDVLRPLTSFKKLEILNYAREHHLDWREDSTNFSDKYLRNRIREKTNKLEHDKKRQLLDLWVQQKSLKLLVDNEVSRLTGNGPLYSRYFFINVDSTTGTECLRHIVKARLTRPQLENALCAIKTALPHKTYDVGGGIKINFTSRNFTVELIK